MANADRIVLVTGATGRQGGSVIRHMHPKGWKLRALTRDPDSPAAQKLVRMGIEVVKGDLENPGTLEPATRGVYGIYSVQDFWAVGASVRFSKARIWRTRQKKPASNTSF